MKITAVAALENNPNIAFAELDALVAPDATANDPLLASQWHLAKIGATSAWDVTQGTGVTVAVLDSGVYAEHPICRAKSWSVAMWWPAPSIRSIPATWSATAPG